ncbi:hypothetical protein F444_23089, partial [Phytophthora nicotianae P1976]
MTRRRQRSRVNLLLERDYAVGPKLNFEEVETPRSVLEVRLATGATVKTEKRI